MPSTPARATATVHAAAFDDTPKAFLWTSFGAALALIACLFIAVAPHVVILLMTGFSAVCIGSVGAQIHIEATAERRHRNATRALDRAASTLGIDSRRVEVALRNFTHTAGRLRHLEGEHNIWIDDRSTMTASRQKQQLHIAITTSPAAGEPGR